MQNRLFFFSFCIVILAGCAVKPVELSDSKTAALSKLLGDIQPQASLKERLALSRAVFLKTQMLTRAFGLTSPPLWHNVLVNIGLRQKGLCYHWADALYLHLSQGDYPHFSFHLAGANIGKYWSEHNALIITKRGEEIENGIIIDPWRDSGDLYFAHIEVDKHYRWVHRKDRGCCLP